VNDYEQQQKRLEEYQKRLSEVQSQKLLIERTRDEANRIRELVRWTEQSKIQQLQKAQQQLKIAIQDKRFQAIHKHTAEIKHLQYQAQHYKKTVRTAHLVNKLDKTNSSLNQKIDKQIENMATKEAQAQNIISRKITQFENDIKSVHLKYMNKQSEQLNIKAENANKKLLAGLKSNQLSKPIYKDSIKGFSVAQDKNLTIYISKKSGVKITDKQNVLTATGGTDSQKAEALIEIAKAKGWNLDNVSFQAYLLNVPF